MKLDIHVHTRKVKSGDAPTRNIETEEFVEIIKDTDVKILAITNHNHFDLKQYEEFSDGVADSCKIWPGIELDIWENEKRAHLIIICNPTNYKEFNSAVQEIIEDKNPDTFTISLKETVEKFDHLDCIYIAHYFVKRPNLGDEELDILIELVDNPKRILKEATNSISAGIYISHGHNSIYGSDVQDWSQYRTISKSLPELRLPVESFEQFCLLLEKDEATINTLLNKKKKENIEIAPFNNAVEIIKIDIYNDINILFGSKGTGKTDILEALSKYYNSKGYKTKVYKSNDLHLDNLYDLKGNSINYTVTEFDIDDCKDEIKFLKEVTEEQVTSINKYLLHFSVDETNKISKKLKVKNIPKTDEKQSNRKLEQVYSMFEEFKSFQDYVNSKDELEGYIGKDLLNNLEDLMGKILNQLGQRTEEKFLESKSVILLNQLIETFINEIAKKTNQPPKPIKTGFADYASNRLKIEKITKKILSNINIEIEPIIENIGSLGEKGELHCKTNLVIQNGDMKESKFSSVQKLNKSPLKEFSRKIKSIGKHIYLNDLFEKVSELNAIDNIDNITAISDLLLFYRHFTINDEFYSPSNGESSMILLYKELKEDKEIYLIDEPEKSLGNDYINDEIVPLLKDRALLGRTVIIATHDANIAVRTLPYSSIYRLHDKSEYFTMTGNPFSNSLTCIYDSRPEEDWKEISMKTLEGGRAAFGERGKIYGN